MCWITFYLFLVFHSKSFSVLSYTLILPPSTLFPPPSFLFAMKLKDGSVLLAYCAVCMMNESCPPREMQCAVVYTAEYRLVFSYGERGKCREDRGLSLGTEGRNEGKTAGDRGTKDVIGQESNCSVCAR